MRGKKVIALMLLIFSLTSYLTIGAMAAALPQQRNVLILNSYNKGHKWTDSIVAGIESVFAKSGVQTNLYYEYMDTKRCSEDKYITQLFQAYETKYRQTYFDAVITSDDDALDFVKKYRRRLFKDTPVIFCGINQETDKVLDGMKNMTGILERPDFINCVDLAAKLHPDARRIIVISDQTRTGQLLTQDFEREQAYMKVDKEIALLSGNSLEKILSSLLAQTQAQDRFIVFCLGMNFQNESGDVVTMAESLKTLRNSVDMPFYSAWDFLLGDGIIGGALVSGFQQGVTAARITEQVLNGKEIDSIPLTTGSPSQYTFDFNMLKKHGIALTSLPYNSRVINMPTEYYTIEKAMVWGAAAFSIFILICVNVALLSNIFIRKKAERELAEREELLRALINGTPDIICYKDGEGKWLEANDAMLELFGIDRTAYRGKSSEEIAATSVLYKTTRAKCHNTDEKVWKQGLICREAQELVMSDASKKTYDMVKAPLFHENGEKRGMVILGRDISAHKAAEEALSKKEEILRATLNATMDGILVVNNERKVMDYNRKFLELWNIPNALMETRDEKILLEYVENQLLNPEHLVMWVNSLYDVKDTDLNHVTFLDGRVYEIQTAPLMAPVGTAESMMGRVWSFKDITQRVMAEKALCESEERYRKLVDFLPDAIFVSSGDHIIYANAAAVNLVGVDARDLLIGKSLLDYIHEDGRRAMEFNLREAVDGRFIISPEEQRLVRADGTYLDTEIVVTAFYSKGEPAVMSVVRDMTERKRANELKRRMDENVKRLNEALEYDKLKTEFFANLSHELRTPLNIILGSLQLFNMTLSGQEVKDAQKDRLLKYTGIMKQNCFRLLRLLNNLIDITRIDSGFFTLQLHNKDIVNVVEGITLSVAEYIENKGIHLIFDTEVEEMWLACDADKIERIILNLLSNAVKFTSEGGVISVRIQKNDSAVIIKVRDTGIGIPSDKLGLIFERFRQVDKSFTRNNEGSGIGLSLVKSLVELHGGRIEVASQPGEGSEFSIKLPVRHLSEAEENTADGAAAESRIERIHIEFSDIYI